MKAKLALIALAATMLGWVAPTAEVAAQPETIPAIAAAAEATVIPTETPIPESSGEASEEAGKTPSDELSAEPEATATPTPTATPSPASTPEPEIRSTTIAAEGLKNYTSHAVDAEALLADGCSLTLPAEGVQILIVHTHSCEAYSTEPGAEYESAGDWRTLDESQNVIAVGEALKAALEDRGLRVLHDKTLHDWPSYNGAYVHCAETIEAYRTAYPEIAMVIDLHRDAIGDSERIYKTVTDTDTPMAQLMFVVGSDENLAHPNWQENLKLALLLQQTALEHCPTLMRPITLSSCRYNQQLTTGSLILEVGTCGNTLAEAVAAVECFAEAVAPLLAAMTAAE